MQGPVPFGLGNRIPPCRAPDWMKISWEEIGHQIIVSITGDLGAGNIDMRLIRNSFSCREHGLAFQAQSRE
ncbi:hypothetical protein N7453_010529 [Penicillium expansum]|nr:hypothetical protein N7453_010529 [Penicillium expansum]